MKQFSLEEYLKNPKMKVVTREGRNVKVYCTDFMYGPPIVAKIEGEEHSHSFYEDGSWIRNGKSPRDLFFATEKHEGWVNIYSGSIKYGGEIYDTENDAKNSASSAVIATIKIEWEE